MSNSVEAAMDSPTELRQIRYVTANYQQVQGLRNVALGAGLVAGGVAYALVPSAAGAAWAFSSALWVGLALNWLAGRYYQRTFGRVDPAGTAWDAVPYAARLVVVPWGMCLIAVLLVVGLPYYVLMAAVGLVGSGGYILYLQRRGGLGLRPYWAVACAGFAALSLVILLPLPLLVLLHRDSGMRTLLVLYLASAGVAMIVCGILDHHLLLTLAPRASTGVDRPFAERAEVDTPVPEPVRMAILTALAACSSADVLFLQRLTGLTMSTLSASLSTLAEAGFLTGGPRFPALPNTRVTLTTAGRNMIERTGNN